MQLDLWTKKEKVKQYPNHESLLWTIKTKLKGDQNLCLSLFKKDTDNLIATWYDMHAPISLKLTLASKQTNTL